MQQAMPDRSCRALVADIGGTKSRLASLQNGCLDLQSVRSFTNSDHHTFSEIISLYAGSTPRSFSEACIAVAGPVTGGRVMMTNLDWIIDVDEISRSHAFHQVRILNDLQALGHAVCSSAPSTLLLEGHSAPPDAPLLVVNIGTGFNSATVYRSAARPLVAASESGHVSFSISSRQELELADYVAQNTDFVSLEEVLSGRGLQRVYAWFSGAEDSARAPAAEAITAMATECETADRALGLFTRILGAAVGNLALTLLPFGGIYLAGSVARALAPKLLQLGFATSFLEKGRYSALMRRFPIHLIEDDHAALQGCAAYLSDQRHP